MLLGFNYLFLSGPAGPLVFGEWKFLARRIRWLGSELGQID